MQDGPFANYTLKLGPGLLVTEHCLTRGVNNTFSDYLNSSMIEYVFSLPTFDQFRVSLEGLSVPPDIGPHGGGHVAIGGDMSNVFSSPGGKSSNETRQISDSFFLVYLDPLFYMHHTNLDRLWWLWQVKFPDHLYQIAGPTTQNPPYIPVTLSYLLQMGNVGSTLSLWDVMDIRKEPNCYVYV